MIKLKNTRARKHNKSSSIERIQKCLLDHRAKSISYEYADDGRITGLTFGIEINGVTVGVRLPARVENVERILGATTNSQKEQAYVTAWANIRDWIEAQLALVDTEMVRMEEVFLPYVVIGSQTVFEKMVSDKFLLKEKN